MILINRMQWVKMFALSMMISFFVNSAQAEEKYTSLYKRPKVIKFPSENLYSKERESLGRTLFFDPRLSGSNWISCATCHNPALSWGDGLPKGIGHGMKELGRRTPTLLNLAWGEIMFWDGRSDSLEEQALAPVAAAGEMNLSVDQLVLKLSQIKGYQTLFDKTYPGEGLNKDTIAKAIATYERTIVSGIAPFDRWIEGDAKAISEEAKRGFVLFNEKAHCAQCHSGWRFTDDGFYDIGLPGEDRGRGAILDLESIQFAFKAPTLRNVDHRAPYMHDGSIATLAQTIEFYNRGGDVNRPSRSAQIKPLSLTAQEKDDLLAFLKTLTSIDKATPVSMLPR